MKKSFLSSFTIIYSLFVAVVFWRVGRARGQQSPNFQLWCVAKNNAPDSTLQMALDWACGHGGTDCSPIQVGGPCYDPPDLQSHASFAFNDYFLRNGLSQQTCDFSGTAALTSLNPSHGKCIFPSSSSVRSDTGGTSAAGITSGPPGSFTSEGGIAIRGRTTSGAAAIIMMVLLTLYLS